MVNNSVWRYYQAVKDERSFSASLIVALVNRELLNGDPVWGNDWKQKEAYRWTILTEELHRIFEVLEVS